MVTATVIKMAGCRLATPRSSGTLTSADAGKARHARRHVADDVVADGEEQKAVKHAQRAQGDDQGRQLEAGR